MKRKNACGNEVGREAPMVISRRRLAGLVRRAVTGARRRLKDDA
jgi:hypothetical protein